MFRRPAIILSSVLFLGSGIYLAQQKKAAPAPARPAAPRTATTTSTAPSGQVATVKPAPVVNLEPHQTLLKTYCSGCHNDKLKTGDMTLTALDLAHVEKNPELTEKIIRKLRVGVMPPAGLPRPPAEGVKSLVSYLETSIDKDAALHPNPG